jgi:hypothetical protein
LVDKLILAGRSDLSRFLSLRKSEKMSKSFVEEYKRKMEKELNPDDVAKIVQEGVLTNLAAWGEREAQKKAERERQLETQRVRAKEEAIVSELTQMLEEGKKASERLPELKRQLKANTEEILQFPNRWPLYPPQISGIEREKLEKAKEAIDFLGREPVPGSLTTVEFLKLLEGSLPNASQLPHLTQPARDFFARCERLIETLKEPTEEAEERFEKIRKSKTLKEVIENG